MFCLKCGEVIPDNSEVCPKCGCTIQNDNSEIAVVYASQKELEIEEQTKSKELGKKYLIWCALAVVSFVILTQKYFYVSISSWFSSSDTSYTGYSLLECLKGSVRLSAQMIVVLIIINIAVIITGLLGIKEIVKKVVIKRLMIVESISSLIVTIIPYFNIREVLKEFDSSLTTTGIGMGCYLSIILSVVMIIIYFMVFSKELSE